MITLHEHSCYAEINKFLTWSYFNQSTEDFLITCSMVEDRIKAFRERIQLKEENELNKLEGNMGLEQT